MKKFTLLMVAALIAVMSWAGVPVREQKQTSLQTTTMLTKAQARQVTPKKAATVRLQAPANNRMAAKAKTGAKKASKKAGLADLLTAQLMLCSEYYEYDSEAGGLVGAAPAAGGTPITISTTAPKKENKIEWVAADQDYESPQDVTEIYISETVAGVFAAGDNTSNSPKYYSSGSAVRMYTGNTLTITSKEPMTKIEITMASNATASQTWLTSDLKEYTYADKVGTWTGEATNQVVFTVPTQEEAGTSSNPQARVAKITIYFAEEESEEEETSPETPTIYIYGFTSSATEAIEATINTTVDEELQAEGVIAEISIADGQTLFESSYGPVLLSNVSGDAGDPLTGYVFSDGYVMIDGLWTDILGGDGQYAGYMWSGLYYYSMVLPVNGTMTWAKSGTANEVPVVIDQDPDEIKTVTVYNFAGEETAVDVTMKADNMFAIDSQLMFDGGTGSDGTVYGEFYTYATDGSSVSATITGTGTEDALTFDGGWTLYAPTTGYWYGLLDPATIAYTDGSQFLYPVIEDVAATPADPVIEEVGNYDAEKEYGYILFDVPTTDVDGNDLRESNLYYQLYSDIAGDIQPITFTTDLYTKLEEDMSIIPYNFTDSYDFDVYEGSKLVYLNYDFNTMYDRIGVKSIYTGGDETNESEIVWVNVEKPEVPVSEDATFDFNKMEVATSSNESSDGDITEAVTFTAGGVTLTISPKDESATTQNRFWGTSNGPQLRMYSGSLGVTSPSGYNITKAVFNYAKWNDGNAADSGEISNDAEAKVATWTGEAQTVVVSIAANTQINSIVVTLVPEGSGSDEAIDPEGITYTFDDGLLGDWTTIDADGDGYTWINTSQTSNHLSAHNGSENAMFSQSYADQKALTPDNYLVSPKVKLGSTFSFFAAAQDAAYPAEHIGVFVSTTGKNAEDFEKVDEWTLTAARGDKAMFSAPGKFRSPKKVQGKWYQYIVDLSAYVGQEGYVAIRHFDCTDMFYVLVDDITFGTPADPDPEPEPDVLVELPEGVTPVEYTLSAAGQTSQSTIDIEDTKLVAFDGTDVYLQGLAYYFPNAFVKGTLTPDNQIQVPTGQFVGEDDYGVEYLVALGLDGDNFMDEENILFDYDAESGVITLVEGTYYGESGSKDFQSLWDYFYEATYTPGALVLPDVVEAPEGLETQTWYLSCDSYNGKIRGREIQIGITTDYSEVYVQGLCEYLPEAWVKGTIDKENFTATFESGQFYGVYNDEYRLFFVGYDSDAEEIADVVFTLDMENNRITTDQWIVLNGKQNSISYYDYYLDIVITKEMPELPQVVEAPSDLITDAYAFKGYDTYYEEDVLNEVQVGFYGENQVYIQGLSGYIEDAWVVGTLEGNTLTIPETYLGVYESLFGSTEVFFSGATFTYDAEAGTFTSEEGYVSYETPEDEYWMDEFSNVVLTKLVEFAATPADPQITNFVYEDTNYPKVQFDIPVEDVDGNPLIQNLLTYQLIIEKDGKVDVLTLAANLYDNLDEDMTEIPYGFSDGWDIYTNTVYLNQGVEEIASWTKLGIQSIYYGGGERNTSNIVWMENPVYDPASAITDVNFNNQKAVIFDMQGRRVAQPAKGLYIVNGKKTVMK